MSDRSPTNFKVSSIPYKKELLTAHIQKTPFNSRYGEKEDQGRAIRELISNFWDQVCATEPDSKKIDVKHRVFNNGTIESWTVYRVTENNRKPIGSIQIDMNGFEDDSRHVFEGPAIVVTNKEASIDFELLYELDSSKLIDTTNIRGRHGEGGKLAMLDILRKSGRFILLTKDHVYKARWGNDLNGYAEGLFADDKNDVVLDPMKPARMFIHEYKLDKDSTTKDVCIILYRLKNLGSTIKKIFDETTFLFLLDPNHECKKNSFIVKRENSIEHTIYFHQSMKGRIYNKGVYVRTDLRLSFGFDSNFYSLGRDRNVENETKELYRAILATYIRVLVSNPVELQQQIKMLYECMETREWRSKSEFSAIGGSNLENCVFDKSDNEKLKSLFVEEFKRLHPMPALPYWQPNEKPPSKKAKADKIAIQYTLESTPVPIDEPTTNELLCLQLGVAELLKTKRDVLVHCHKDPNRHTQLSAIEDIIKAQTGQSVFIFVNIDQPNAAASTHSENPSCVVLSNRLTFDQMLQHIFGHLDLEQDVVVRILSAYADSFKPKQSAAAAAAPLPPPPFPPAALRIPKRKREEGDEDENVKDPRRILVKVPREQLLLLYSRPEGIYDEQENWGFICDHIQNAIDASKKIQIEIKIENDE